MQVIGIPRISFPAFARVTRAKRGGVHGDPLIG